MQVLDIDKITDNLRYDKRGFWITDSKAKISYPNEGNQTYARLEENSFWFNHRNEVIKTTINNFSAAKTLFDIGGGNGFVARAVEAAGSDYVLVEPGINGVLTAVERGVKKAICATLEDANFHPNSLTAIGLFDVAEHVEDDVSFLRQLHNLLVPNGKAYITVPAFNLLWSSEDVYAGHFRRYTLQSLTEALKQANFRVQYATYFFSFLPAPIFLLRTLPTFLGIRRSVSTDVNRKEHTAHRGLFNYSLNKILSTELSQIQKKRVLPFGTSILAVAQK